MSINRVNEDDIAIHDVYADRITFLDKVSFSELGTIASKANTYFPNWLGANNVANSAAMASSEGQLMFLKNIASYEYYLGGGNPGGLSQTQLSHLGELLGDIKKFLADHVDNMGVPPVNQAPVAVADALEMLDHSTLTLNASAFTQNDHDPEGGPVQMVGFSNAHNVDVKLNADGLIEIKSTNTGAASFDYTISDDKGLTSTTTVTIHVKESPNVAPVANEDILSGVLQGATKTFTLADLLANDTDANMVNGDAIRVKAVGIPDHGSVTIKSDGSVEVNTEGAPTGDLALPYMIEDSHGASAWSWVKIPVNAPDLSMQAAPNTKIEISVENLVKGDITKTVDLSSIKAEYGEVQVVGDKVKYTGTDAHTDFLSYNVVDKGTGAVSGFAAAVSAPVNAASIVANDDYKIAYQFTGSDVPYGTIGATSDLILNDSSLNGIFQDSHGPIIDFSNIQHGTIDMREGAGPADPDVYIFKPDAGFTGEALVNYKVWNADQSAYAIGTIHFNVVKVFEGLEDTPLRIGFEETKAAGLTDVTIVGLDGMPNSGISQDGKAFYIDKNADPGISAFNFIGKDANGNTVSDQVFYHLAKIDQPVIVGDDTLNMNSNESLLIRFTDLNVNDSLKDGFEFTPDAIQLSQPVHGTLERVDESVTGTSLGGWKYTPEAGFTGTETLTQTRMDFDGDVGVGELKINVGLTEDTSALNT